MTGFLEKHKNLFTIIGLFAVFYLIFFHNIGTYPLMDIDETRYVLMSKDMLKSGNFMTLYLNGEYFFEKPPLYFWIECLSFKLFGAVNEFSARFPAGLCGMATSFLVYFCGRKIVSEKYGIVSSLVLATCLEYTILAKYAILDIFLCTLAAFSVFSYFLTLFVQEKNKKYFWWLFYIFSALAVMAKGVPGAAIPFGTAFFVSIYTRTFKEIFKPLYILPGIALFLLITLPWHIIMLKTHPTFYHEYIVKHHLQRFLNSEELGRKQPWYYFLITVTWGIVPWTLSLFAAAGAKLKKLKSPNLKPSFENAKLFLAVNIIAALFTLFFFSSSSTKLITYILPVYPFMACIIGYIWTKYLSEGCFSKEIEVSSYIFSGFCILCGVSAIFMQFFLPQAIYADIKSIQWFCVASILLTQVPAVIFLVRKNKKGLFGCYILFILVLSAWGTPQFYRLDYAFGQNDLMEYAKLAKESNATIYAINTGRRFSLNYYGYGAKVAYLKDVDYSGLSELEFAPEALILVKNKEIKNNEKAFADFTEIKKGRKYTLIKEKEPN